ncbi:MAG: endonuclease/exonuclease/phosphatase family protein [Gammaproteobacteria bacterium]|nr:endonuclease/exonuclease/phosphatase family protein [Gammaproteobacteria bacterium]MBU1656001.1 endonuclease/exonuclease/phosphatase family protein [Gammaproteobacteria bacterium]MBU1962209.1 endonuclease/exonuclease/phosphatase family protein [Gammaproteobacteria bacterium]
MNGTEGVDNLLRILSYNIQSGVDTYFYRHYVTRGWRNWLPHRQQVPNLDKVAGLVGRYDIVGLQEVDSGSLRSNFMDQTAYIAQRAGFRGWHRQVNRDLGPLGQHSNGLLSRFSPLRVEEHRLPGNVPGRGALLALFGRPGNELAVCVVHLALGQWARKRQLRYVSDLIRPYAHVVVMGDMNCGCHAPELVDLVGSSHLREPTCEEASFPSWRPMRRIDHILVSDKLEVVRAEVVNFPLSDHLPVHVEVKLPADLALDLEQSMGNNLRQVG